MFYHQKPRTNPEGHLTANLGSIAHILPAAPAIVLTHEEGGCMMKAFVMKHIGHVGFLEKPIPEIGPSDALVHSKAALVSEWDCQMVRGSLGAHTDLTLGHQAVGIVDKVGANVKLFQPGDRVVAGRGIAAPADLGKLLPVENDGVFAEYFLVKEADFNMAAIPSDVSDESAVYVADTMSRGLKGAENARIPMGGTVAIFSQGGLGLMATVGSRLQGAARILAVESIPARQDLARHYGADEIIDVNAVDAVDRIFELTSGQGVDSAIEALGLERDFQQAVSVTRAGGTISTIAYYDQGEFVHIPKDAWGSGMAGKTIQSAQFPNGRQRLTRLLSLIANGRVNPSLMTTHHFPFSRADEAYHIMDRNLDGVINVLITFDE